MKFVKETNIIQQKQEKLKELQLESSNALDIVTRTISQLSNVNDEIDITINEIQEAKSKLEITENDLNVTKLHNAKVIEKFRTLIGIGD